MKGGFSFCGVDIAKLGLEYVPTLDKTYVYAGSDYSVHQETFDAQHGGYFYGTTVQPKDFTLRCFFQDRHINSGILGVIESFFYRGRTGKLIFAQRDWLWYTATVVDINIADLRNRSNGFVTIALRAYYPFSRHDYLFINGNNASCECLIENSGLIEEEYMPNTMFTDISESMDILLYNGGSEKASVAIAIAGDAGEGVIIKNKTTCQTCEFVSFTKAITTDENKYIVTDSLNGKTVLTDGVNSEFSFLYHNQGFLELEPSFPIERKISVTYAEGSNEIILDQDNYGTDYVGNYLWLTNRWHKILNKTNDGLYVIDELMLEDGICETSIVKMNEIHIELKSRASLSRLDFIYKPTFQ